MNAAEIQEWRREVQARGRCVCGNTDHLTVHFVIPPEQGGTLVPENGLLLCRACTLYQHRRSSPGSSRPFQCLLLAEDLEFLTAWADRMGHSRASWVRTLMAAVVESPGAYKDLASFDDPDYTDTEEDLVRTNLHLDAEVYEAFGKAVSPMTTVGALRARIRMEKITNGPQ